MTSSLLFIILIFGFSEMEELLRVERPPVSMTLVNLVLSNPMHPYNT